jgi:DNA-directed RNA polymerase specialized sigma subunit
MVNFTRALSEREQIIAYMYDLEMSHQEIAAVLNSDLESARIEIAALFMKNERLKQYLAESGSPRSLIQRAYLLA